MKPGVFVDSFYSPLIPSRLGRYGYPAYPGRLSTADCRESG